MSEVFVKARKCDIEGCNEIAKVVCGKCGKDLCLTEHTHAVGDGGHIQHAVRVTALPWPYGGVEEAYLCPNCYWELLSGVKWKQIEHPD